MTDSDTSTTPTPSVTVRPKTSFGGDVLKLVSGTTIAQLLGILASPILTRLYSPEAFGLLALFTSITSILSVIACLRYEQSIMLPETDKEAVNLLAGSLLFTLFISLLTVPLVWWGGDIFVNWFSAAELGQYLWFVPVMVLASGFFTALNYWNSRTKHFDRLAKARVSQSVASVSAQVCLGFLGLASSGALIGSSVGGKMLATVILSGQNWRDSKIFFLRSIHWRQIFDAIKRYRKFPQYGIGAALLNSISWQLPAFLLALFFSPSVVGYYALGFRILQMPMNLVGQAVSQVFFQRASEAKLEGTLGNLVEDVFRRLVMIGMFPMLLLTIIGREAYVTLFGSNWAEAGVYTQILAVWAFFWFISSPMGTLFSVLEKQEFGLKLNIFIFLSRVAALSIGGYLANPRLALLLFAGTGILSYGYLSVAMMTASGVSSRKMYTTLAQSLLYFMPFGLLTLTVFMYGVHGWALIFVSMFLYFTYALLVWRLHPELFTLDFRKATGSNS